ncbi:MAG: RNA 2',3'-cyclic phosphodiesterase [Myxococcota bacterium]|nr:RNA 2',3'-cyclic phosphodiesterase [Myxococcota bacterium]
MTTPEAKPQPPREEHQRLFVGIRVSVATANALAGAAETLARRARDAGVDIRWVAPVNYHLTLKFLGSTRKATVGALRDVLEAAAAGTPRFTLRAARLGAFASLDKANVVWAGIQDTSSSGALDLLARQIEQACTGLGFTAESRPYHPHVTLGRLRETRAVRDVVLPLAEQMFGDTPVDSITLFESETKSGSSVYRELHRINFKTVERGARGASERQTPALQLDPSKQSSEASAESETDDGWPRSTDHRHHDDH